MQKQKHLQNVVKIVQIFAKNIRFWAMQSFRATHYILLYIKEDISPSLLKKASFRDKTAVFLRYIQLHIIYRKKKSRYKENKRKKRSHYKKRGNRNRLPRRVIQLNR